MAAYEWKYALLIMVDYNLGDNLGGWVILQMLITAVFK